MSMIRSMTAFGSPLNLAKALDFSLYSSMSAHRNKVHDYLNMVRDPNANIIAFDTETTGTKTILEEYNQIKGQTYAKPTEFSVRSTSGFEAYGFTKYSDPRLLKALAKDPEYGAEFSAALGRRQAYKGELHTASSIVNQIANAIVPGKKNILLGHNIGAFDLKVLSSQYALEKGFVSKADIIEFHEASRAWGSQRRKEAQRKINAGWQRAADEINQIFKAKDPNLVMMDTLGRFKKGTFVTPMKEGSGLISSFMKGYLPGVRETWEMASKGAGLSEKEAFNQSLYAASKGTSLGSFMNFLGMKFEGPAHDPRADTLNNIRMAQSDELFNLVGSMDNEIKKRDVKSMHSRLIGFLGEQQAEQAEVLKKGSPRADRIRLAKFMTEAKFDKTPPVRFQILEDLISGFKKSPLEVKIGMGALGGLLALNAMSGLFRHDRKISANDEDYRQFSGMHPGNGGYATSNIRSMTHFGSGSIFGLRGFSAVSGLTGAFLKPEEIATKLLPILNFMPTKKEFLSLQFRTGLRQRGFNSKTTKKAILNYYNDTLKIKKAISNHNGINGMIIVDPSNPELRYTIRHERQHFYNDISSKQSGSYGLSLEDVDPTFQKNMRGDDHYSKQINAQGEETIIDEWIAYTAANHPLHRLMFSEELQFSAIRAGKQNKAIAKQFLKEQRIEGLHPGLGGVGKAQINNLTDFGSSTIKSKVVNRAASVFKKITISTRQLLDQKLAPLQGDSGFLAAFVPHNTSLIKYGPSTYKDTYGLLSESSHLGISKTSLRASKRAANAFTYSAHNNLPGILALPSRTDVPAAKYRMAKIHEKQHFFNNLVGPTRVREILSEAGITQEELAHAERIITNKYPGYSTQMESTKRIGLLGAEDEILAFSTSGPKYGSRLIKTTEAKQRELSMEDFLSGNFDTQVSATSETMVANSHRTKGISPIVFPEHIRRKVLLSARRIRQEGLRKLEGLHPGNKGVATSVIQNMTDFGSGIGLDKVVLRAAKWLEQAGFNKENAALKMVPAARSTRGVETLFSGTSHGSVASAIKNARLNLSEFEFGFVTTEKIPTSNLSEKIFLPREATEKLYGFKTSDHWRAMKANSAGLTGKSRYQMMIDLINERSVLQEGIHPGAGPDSLGKSSVQNHSEFGSGWSPRWVSSRLLRSFKRGENTLKQRPTAGLMSVLESAAHGSKKYMSRQAIR